MNDPQQQQKKNRRTIVILASMSIIPFTIAWLLTKNPDFRPKSTHNGDLIVPVMTTERSELQGIDDFSIKNIDELKGHWVMLNIINSQDCNKVCADAIHATKQLRLMLNKDLTRVRRAVIVVDGLQQDAFQAWWKEDDRLIKVKPDDAMMKKLTTISQGKIKEGMLIIMDPLGNLMMQYPVGFDPYDVKRDLKKLLRISQIG